MCVPPQPPGQTHLGHGENKGMCGGCASYNDGLWCMHACLLTCIMNH